MCVIIGLAFLTVSLPLGDCFDHYQGAHARLRPAPLLLAPMKANRAEMAPIPSRKRQKAHSRIPPSGGRIALARSRAGATQRVALDKIATSALVSSKPTSSGKFIDDSGGYASLASMKCKDGTGAISPTIDAVGGVANALTLGRVDQGVCVAKSYLENLKLGAAKYYRDLAIDRAPLEQSEATINLVPGPSLLDKPQQGISNLKVLRKEIEKELAIDEAEAQNNPLVGSQRKRILNARLIIGRIGTDEDLDRALTYLDALRTEPQWPDLVKLLTAAMEEEAKLKFESARAKAMKLGGIQKLTLEDIDGLSYEQIKQLRGY
jgi:hypothetical protein